MSQPWNDPRIDPVKPSTIAVIPTGSYAYGLETEASDRDYGTVYVDRLGEVLNSQRWNVHGQRLQTSTEESAGPDDVDRTDYTLPRIFTLLHESSPSVVPMLWSQPEFATAEWSMILEHRELFLLPKLPRAMFEYGKSTFQNGFGWGNRKKMVHGLRILYVGLELVNNRFVQLPLEEDVRDRLMQIKLDSRLNTKAYGWHTSMLDDLMPHIKTHEDSYVPRERTEEIWELCAHIHEVHWGYKSLE